MADYKEAIELLVLGHEGLITNEDDVHEFKCYQEGDGWNEPLSDSSSCECGWDGLSWVQIDRECSNRPELVDHVMLWVQHIQEDVWKEEEDDRVSEDTDAVQA